MFAWLPKWRSAERTWRHCKGCTVFAHYCSSLCLSCFTETKPIKCSSDSVTPFIPSLAHTCWIAELIMWQMSLEQSSPWIKFVATYETLSKCTVSERRFIHLIRSNRTSRRHCMNAAVIKRWESHARHTKLRTLQDAYICIIYRNLILSSSLKCLFRGFRFSCTWW